MIVTEHVPLRTLTTFKSGGDARIVVVCTSEQDVRDAVALAKEKRLPWYVLGEGSNVLPADEGYAGVVIVMRMRGVSYAKEGGRVVVTAEAGESWDSLVTDVTGRGLWGCENLAGIPGTVGAAPVQNIGAYGAELSHILLFVDVLNTETGAVERLSKEECTLSYRDSRFKHEFHLVITRAAFTLSEDPTPRITYGDLLKAQEEGVDLSTPSAIAKEVRRIRHGKFPDLTKYGTAGSFFKNPVLTPEVYASLVATHGSIPQFPHPRGIKIPLAFVLDKILSLRGYRKGRAWLFGAQPLVLVLDEGGSSTEIEALAQEIEEKVRDAVGLVIEREVRTMPSH